MSSNISNNQVNVIINNKLNFDLNYSLAKDHIKYTEPVVKFDLEIGNNVYVTYADGLILKWDSRNSYIMIRKKQIKLYMEDFIPNRVEYSAKAGTYHSTYYVKVLFFVSSFSIRNIITKHF